MSKPKKSWDESEHRLLLAGHGPQQTEPSKARHMFMSRAFVHAKEYAVASKRSWWVLHPAFGLLHPDDIIRATDMKLSDLSDKQLSDWVEKVVKQISAKFGEGHITLVTPYIYGDVLCTPLRRAGFEVDDSLANMLPEDRIAELKKLTAAV